MLKQMSSDSTESCTNCAKNCTLMKKYEQLVRLYKKKQLKLSIDGSSRISNGRTTSNTLDLPSYEAPCMRLVQVMAELAKSRLSPIFRFSLPKSAKKFILLNLFNRFDKFAKAGAFCKLKDTLKQNPNQIAKILDQRLKSTLRQAYTTIKNYNGNSVIQQLITDLQTKPLQCQQREMSCLRQLNQSTKNGSNTNKWLHRRNMELQIINKKLTLQNQNLRQCLQESAKRQAKENQKKKQSLQMLAEEISEKNQEIMQLKQSLKAFQETYQPNGNVLQDDAVQLRKDLDHLENIRNRLENDLDKVKTQLQQTNKNLKAVTLKKEEIQKQNIQIKKTQFQVVLKGAKSEKAFTQFSKLIKTIDKKMKRLNIYEKQLQEALLKGKQVDKSASNIVQQQIKSQIILLYLTNINVSDYKLYAEHLFDDDEKDLLKHHKQAWLKHQHDAKMMTRVDNVSKLHHLDISEIGAKGGHMDSVLMALDSPREQKRGCGPTMRMLELQLEKSKQVQKISELKQKLLHVRVIILKLIKSLELQAGMKGETQGILRVLFDLFEYSQEERDSVFTKKKKLFGLI